SVVLGDFPGNESMMLIVACAMGVVRVFPGNGDGSFDPGRTFPAGRLPAAAALGDFNLDGIPDLAIVNTGSSTVSVLLGSAGTFQTVPTVDAGAQPSFMSLGYFSHNGMPDVAVTDLRGRVSVLLGNGKGSFDAAGSYAAGVIPSCVAVADL